MLTGSASSDDGVATFSLSAGVNTGQSVYVYGPPPSSNAGDYANANANLSGTGDHVSATVELHDEVNLT